jgi:hypothetical protein
LTLHIDNVEQIRGTVSLELLSFFPQEGCSILQPLHPWQLSSIQLHREDHPRLSVLQTPLLDCSIHLMLLPLPPNIPTTQLRLLLPLACHLNCWQNTRRACRHRTTAPLVGCLPDSFFHFP